MKSKFVILLSFITSFGYSQVLKGKVVDAKTGKGVAFAELFCIETQNGTTSDLDGNWELENEVNFQKTIVIKAVEFESKLIKIEDQKSELIIQLRHSHIDLDEVIVSTTSSKLQRNTTTPVLSRKITDLNKIDQTTLIDALSNIPGIYNLSTGNGISKPVIRGLSGMRVLTVQNGLRIENQQWGADHGFAVFNIGIDRVEVIKGPSSLIYGNDALGGVIFVADEPYANSNKTEIKASSKFETNSMATTNNISYKTSKNNLRIALYGGYFNRSDYQLANKQFVSNSQNNGSSFKSAIGYNKNNWISNFRYQILHFRIGLPGHTHDANWDVSSFISSNQTRNETRPAQIITNHLAQWENKFYFKNNELVTQLGFTYNGLKEFEKIFTPEIDMTLQNYSYNFKWKHKINNNFEIVSGSQGLMQSNSNDLSAEQVLVADANFLDFGAYTSLKGTFNIWDLQLGARYDHRNVKTLENIDPFLKNFDGFNYSIGVSRSSKKFTTRLNASSGFNPDEVID